MANPEKIITRDVVFEAAQAIKAAGEEPTNRKLLHAIGGGSMTTIASYLREWKAQQSIEAPTQIKESDPVPGAVMDMGTKAIADVWQACRAEAYKEVEKVTAEANSRVQSISEERDNALNEIAESEKELEAERQHVAELEEENADLCEKVDVIRSDRDRVVGTNQQQEKEINRLKSEMDTVRQSAKSDIEKITIDREKIASERDALQKDITIQSKEFDNLKKTYEELKNRFDALKDEKDSLSKDFEQLIKDNVKLEGEIKNLFVIVSEKDQLVGRLDEKNGEIMSLKGLLSECMKNKADRDKSDHEKGKGVPKEPDNLDIFKDGIS